MNWDFIQGNWRRLRGRLQHRWGRLTDDDLKAINGKRLKLVDKVQERYGYERDRAEAEVRQFCDTCDKR
ncbi:MAG TPA: CsbD family protein [Lacipirellulaceae bacterium]|nr:CsbD family protein [Lacipirellulaceae bacterium]